MKAKFLVNLFMWGLFHLKLFYDSTDYWVLEAPLNAKRYRLEKTRFWLNMRLHFSQIQLTEKYPMGCVVLYWGEKC